MRIAIVADEAARAGWLSRGTQEDVETIWLDAPAYPEGVDGCIDLLFSNSEERIQAWVACAPPMVIINDVVKKNELPSLFVRMNGWPSFLERPVAEMAGPEMLKAAAEKIAGAYNRTAEWVPDIPGLITARVVSMVINEAYFSLEEEVSTKAEIDTAMKLGTNYPYGPFEWARKIGLHNVYELLNELSSENSRYAPAGLLKKEAFLP